LSPKFDLNCDTSTAICTIEAEVSKIVADALRIEALPKAIVATDIHGIVFNSSIVSDESGSSGTEWTLSAVTPACVA
jgi:hypothetical protein